jgi:hypothetical protein
MNSKGLAQLAYEKGMYILTAAQSYQAALETSKLGHGYLTYTLVEEGLKTAAADREPRDCNIDAREWFDFAVERVPQIQEEKGQGKRLLVHEKPGASPDDRHMGETEKRQRPRAFYRQEHEIEPFIVAKPYKAGGRTECKNE